VINISTNSVTATIEVGGGPVRVAVTRDGSRVYVANTLSDTVSVTATATNTVIAAVNAGVAPAAFGVFIGPAPPSPAPTLGTWGLLLSALLLGGGGYFVIRNRVA